MEGLRRDAKLLGLATDLVECDETVVAVEGGVLEALSHHRPAVLLQLHREAHHGMARKSGTRLGHDVGREQAVQEIEHAGRQLGRRPPRGGERPVKVAAIGVGGFALAVDIGAVDGKSGHHFTDRALKQVAREIGGLRILLRRTPGIAAEHVQLARHLVVHDAQFARVHDAPERRPVIGETLVEAGERLLAGGIHQHAQHEIGKLVAGGAFHGPVGPELFVPREDLLHHEIERPRRGGAQPVEIFLGVEQSVDMIDPDAVERAVLQHLADAHMRGLEHDRQFHADPGQVVDVEEATVVDVVAGDMEAGDAPELLVDQLAELDGRGVDAGEHLFEVRARALVLADQRGEHGFQYTGACRDLRAPRRQVGERVAEPLERAIRVTEDVVVK